MKHYLNVEEREALAALVDSDAWPAVKKVLEHHVAHQLKTLASQPLTEGSEKLVHTKARYEGADWLAKTAVADINAITKAERQSS